MSREAYHPPTLIPPPQTSNSTSTSTTTLLSPQSLSNNPTNQGAASSSSGPTIADATRAVQYLCGDCNAKVLLNRGDLVRCKECGHRVLYKERTNRMVQFEAR